MNDQISQQLIGRRIKSVREEAGLTQEELGKKIGYSAMGISYFEKGLRKIKTGDIEKIAQALNKSINFFLQPLTGYTSESSNDISGVMFRRGSDEISDEEKMAEKEALKDFDQYVRSMTD